MAYLRIITYCFALILLSACTSVDTIKEVNIGYIGPLSVRATDLGIAPSKAMILAVEQYNANRAADAPLVNLFIEDDQWEKEKAIEAYDRLRKKHNIDVVLVSNTDGTIALQERIMKDNVILVNPTNNDRLLSSLNENTFKIAKSTEEANGLVGKRIIDLDLKKVIIFHYPNDFMTRGANAVKELLDEAGIQNKLVMVKKGDQNFEEELKECKEKGCDAYVMFGYKEFGFMQKQARDMGITAPFYGSTTQLVPDYYKNSEGAIIGSEFPFFTPSDGNYVLAHEFLEAYKLRFGEEPFSVWPPMQAYDAINLVMSKLSKVNSTIGEEEKLGDWLKRSLFEVKHYRGVCGNIAIQEDGSSRGIYFSLYRYIALGEIELVQRD
jgi:ABC-type branched-subunit amino acid transport system substrate-binding protein